MNQHLSLLARVFLGLIPLAFFLGLVNCAIQLIDQDYALRILEDTTFKSQTGRFMAVGFFLILAGISLAFLSAFIVGWPRIRPDLPDWWDG